MNPLTLNYTIMSKHTHLNQRIYSAQQYLNHDIELSLTDHHCLIISLNRTEKRNALSFDMMKKLIWLAEQINDWRDIRSVILQGHGASFCAGIDLDDLNNPKNLKIVAWELLKPYQSLYQKVCLVWRELAVPVIAVIHGHCIGAGLQLALACDIRIVTPNCQFAIMESKWGLVPDMALTQSALGIAPDKLKELAMTARIFDSQTALEYGFISYISDTPLIDAQNLATELAERSPDAVLASKRIINQMYRQSAHTLYLEKLWQIKLLIGKNQKLAIKKVKDKSIEFLQRQFK